MKTFDGVEVEEAMMVADDSDKAFEVVKVAKNYVELAEIIWFEDGEEWNYGKKIRVSKEAFGKTYMMIYCGRA